MMMNLDLKQFNSSTWAECSAKIIQAAIKDILIKKGRCNILLPGGRSAESLYSAWNQLAEFRLLSGVNIYFCDERCVHKDDAQSNYQLALSTLFHSFIPDGCRIFRIEAEDLDIEKAALRYADLLPSTMDIAIFGVGEDGHIASLFPENPSIHESSKLVMPIIGPKAPFQRITLTPLFFKRINKIFILANGASKSKVLIHALEEPYNTYEYPVRLIIHGTWLIDSEIIIPND
jgi:6-phosphogluconolactonase